MLGKRSIYYWNLSKTNWKQRCGNACIICKISGRNYQLSTLLFYNEKDTITNRSNILLSLHSFLCFGDGKCSVVICGQDDSFRQEIPPQGLALQFKKPRGEKQRRKSGKASLETKAAYRHQKLDRKRLLISSRLQVVCSIAKPEEMEIKGRNFLVEDNHSAWDDSIAFWNRYIRYGHRGFWNCG